MQFNFACYLHGLEFMCGFFRILWKVCIFRILVESWLHVLCLSSSNKFGVSLQTEVFTFFVFVLLDFDIIDMHLLNMM